MAKHARLSASGTKEWGNCGGQLALIALLPEGSRDDTNDAARLGTCAHALLETCLQEGVDAEAYHDRIIVIQGEGSPQEETVILKARGKAPKDPTVFWALVDENMEEAVQQAIDYVRSRLMHHFGDPDTKAAVLSKRMRLEQRLTILVARDDSFGTGDIIIDAWPEELENLDYKHGERVAVEILDEEGPNKQLQSYALGCAEEAGWDYGLYTYGIIQPRASHPDGRIRTHSSSPDELREFKAWLTNAASNVDRAFELLHEVCSDTPDGSSAVELADVLFKAGLLVPGSQCKWCKAKFNPAFGQWCPAQRSKAEEVAQMDFADNPPEDLALAVEDRVPLDQYELAQMRRWVPFLEQLAKAVKAAADKRAFAGDSLPGFKLVRGKTTGRKFITQRQATDTETGEPIFLEDGETPMMVDVTREWLVQQLLEVYQVPDKDKLFNPSEFRTGPQIEKEVPKAQRKAFSDNLLWKPPGPVKLVRDSDPGEAITIDPASDFADEENDELLEGSDE